MEEVWEEVEELVELVRLAFEEVEDPDPVEELEDELEAEAEVKVEVEVKLADEIVAEVVKLADVTVTTAEMLEAEGAVVAILRTQAKRRDGRRVKVRLKILRGLPCSSPPGRDLKMKQTSVHSLLGHSLSRK